ncbi:MAG TPA: hypothetical protein VK919_10435 [Solirubrobacterales bacterium]|nr:hypothetical protein [Solirubrobacterales bacterium]
MGHGRARGGAWISVAVPLVASMALALLAGAASVSPAAAATAKPAPKIRVLAAARAEGRVVRSERGLTVRRVPGAARAGASGALRRSGPRRALWGVRLAGHYPPRALRYELLANGRPIAYAIPSSGKRALEALTADPVVLTARISARYGGRAAGRVGAARSSRAGAGERPAAGTADAGRRAGAQIARVAGVGRGPLEVGRTAYNLGKRAFKPSRIRGRVEVRGIVHFPSEAAGPFPLVLFMHGNHDACFKGERTRYEWPCRKGFRPIPNHAGYDYIAERLASFGFVVASVSANGVNVLGNQVGDTGMRQRGELLQRHVALWRKWATSGGAPFGDSFLGKIDLTRIGTMGHSRGGEGAIWQVILDRRRAQPFGIRAVLPLAPVDFTRRTVNGIPLGVVLPYCDGDVFDLQGIHYFDDARYRLPGDPAPKHTVTVMGANHNFFNTVWSPGGGYPGAIDDGRFVRRCRGRLKQGEQRRVGAVYVADFFRRYLGDDLSLDPTWTGASTPPEIAPARAITSYHAPDLPGRRLDLNRFTRRRDLTRNRLGGSVSAKAMPIYRWCRAAGRRPCVPGRFRFLDVHLGDLFGRGPARGLSRATLGWTKRRAAVRFELPPGEGDVSGYDALQFRAAPNPGYAAARRTRLQDLAIRLTDGAGNRARVAASEVGRAPLRLDLAGLRRFSGHIILNQLHFPLARFGGVDLTDLRAVELRFSRTDHGVIDVADLAFTRGAP